MPQLDTVYTFMTYLWTWTMLFLTTQKTMTTLIIKVPKPHNHKTLKAPKLALPWT